VSISQQFNLGPVLQEHVKRIRILERLACGPWIYVGDPGAPAFQNGFSNQGGGKVPMRFRRNYGCGSTIQGRVTGGARGDVVFTLPPAYAPDYELTLDSSDNADAFVVLHIFPSGDVVFGQA
jgi:hypothetical protein